MRERALECPWPGYCVKSGKDALVVPFRIGAGRPL